MKYFMLTLATLIMVACSSKNDNKQVETTSSKKEATLQLYSLRDDIAKDYTGTIKKVGEMGFTYVEAAGYDNGKFYGKNPEEFKSDVEAAGMKVLSSHASKQLSDKELKSKDFAESLKWWDQCIDAHKAAGASYIVDPWMAVPKSLKDLQSLCEYLNEIGKRCKDNGIQFGYHNHNHEFTKVEDQMMYDYMIEHTNPDYVFYQMDVYWVVRGGQSPVDYLNKYPKRFKLLHLKDNKELGQSGMVGFDAVLRNTDAGGVEHLVLEVEHYSMSPMESVKASLDYLLESPCTKAALKAKQ